MKTTRVIGNIERVKQHYYTDITWIHMTSTHLQMTWITLLNFGGKKIQLLCFYNKIKITIIELKVEESTQKRAERDYVYYVTYPATV